MSLQREEDIPSEQLIDGAVGIALPSYDATGHQSTGLAPASLIALLQTPACLLNGAATVMSLNAAWRNHAAADAVRERMPWAQLLCPEDRHIALSQFRSATMTGRKADFECRVLDDRGDARWFLISLQPLNGERDGDFRWLCLATDIHEFKSKEADLKSRESIQTDMLNISVDCIKLIALDGTVIHMNRAGCLALGVPENSVFGMPWLPLLPKDVWVDGEKALANARVGTFSRFAGRSVLPGQNAQYWDNMLTPVMSPSGQPTAILCVSREVTAEREALDSLRESEERLTTAVNVGGLGIWDYNILRDELRCDDVWYRIMGRDCADPIRSMAEFHPMIHPEDVDRATEVERTAAELTKTQSDYAIIFRIIRPNGDIRWVRSAACLLQDEAGQAARAVGFVVDITDAWRGELALRDANRALEEEKTSLARQSLEDPLTGIANRRHLDSELARICLRATETGESLCVGMIDVDHFKAYNDRYGHLEGDAALAKVAAALQSVARQSDFVARYGGEEFAFVLPGISDPAGVLNRFRETLSDLAIVHGGSPTGYLTISCGCVVSNSKAELVPTALLRASDEALYEAKLAGRDRFVIRPDVPPDS